MLLDVFKKDAFNLVSLTESIEMLPFVPSKLGSMGLFAEKGITTVTALVESRKGKLSLIPTQARGTMPTVAHNRDRTIRSFVIPHLPLNDAVMADEVQGVRAFGSEDDEDAVADMVTEKLGAMKQDMEVTKEWHRIGAIKGVVLDADGTTVIYDFFDEFGITEKEILFDMTNDNLKLKALEVRRYMETELGAAGMSGITAVCGDQWWDDLVSAPYIKDAYNRWQDGQFFRENQREGFPFAEVTWMNYRGSLGEVPFIGADECRFFPTGVNRLFTVTNAPAPFIETVNTVGKPIYAKQEVMKWDIGVELHVQSNPLFMCTRPGLLVKGTR